MGSSALKAKLGWLTLFPLIDEKVKNSDWDKCLILAYSRSNPREARSSSRKPSSGTSSMHTDCLYSTLGLLNDVCFIIYQFHT